MAEVDIIDLWNKGKSDFQDSENINVDELITKKSQTPLYWIKVILWIEFWLNVASIPAIFLIRDQEPVLYGIVMPIVIVIYLVYYQFLIQKIKKFDYSTNVLTGLRKLYNYLNFFFLHYKVVIWFSLTFSYSYSIFQESAKHADKGSEFWLPVVGIGLVIVLIVGFILTFLINLIYGRKIKRLKGIVKELETE